MSLPLVTLDVTKIENYHLSMIRSFRDGETEKVWQQQLSRALPRDIQSRALMKLQQLNAAADLRDLRIPLSNYLEKLKGARKHQWSIRINDQWRICFEWKGGDAHQVEICDYH